MTGKPLSALRAVFILLLSIIGSLLAYTFLHEAGHALTALSFGGKVIDFSVNFLDMSAHVSLEGNLSPTQNAWINASGAAFPFIVWMLGMLALPRRAAPTVQLIKGIMSLIVVNTLLAWVALPLLFIFRCAPPGDDVTKFLANSQAAPFTVTLITLGLYALGWALMVRRIEQPGTALSAFLKIKVPPIPAATVAALVAFSALLLVVSGISFTTCREQSRVPAGFALVKDIELSAQTFDKQPLISFTLTAPERVGFLLRVQNLNTPYLEVTLKKTGGDPITLLHGKGFSTSDNITQLDLMLGAGDYQVLLSSQKSTGNLRLYLNRP